MGDILSQQEIDALVTRKEGEGQAVPGIHGYDFKHPARVNRDQLRTLESLHDNFARLLSANFSSHMGAVVDADTAFVDQTTYAEYIMSLSNPSCSYLFTVGPYGGQAVVDIAMPIAFGYLDRRFGGKGSSQGVDPRQLSQIEMAEMVPLVKRMIADLEATWEPVARVEISQVELETNPEFMQITPAHEIVLLLAFEINAANLSGLVSLCYPFFTAQPLIARFGRGEGARRLQDATPAQIRANRRRLAAAPLDLRVELGKGRLTVAQARGLKRGDVLVTGSCAAGPAAVYVGGKPKLEGLPFAEGGRHKVRITGPMSAAVEAANRD